MKISNMTMADYNYIIENISRFWDERGPIVLGAYHSMYVHEFCDSAFVCKNDDGKIAGHAIALYVHTQKILYIHLLGVDEECRRQRVAEKMYKKCFEFAESVDCLKIKAITQVINKRSIAFHTSMGFTTFGESVTTDGIKFVKDYRGKGEDRVVFYLERGNDGKFGKSAVSKT